METAAVSTGETDRLLVLIGDSIRLGYQATVRQHLPGTDIWSPEANGGDSANVLAHLDQWVGVRSPCVVHLNCGLHDLKKPFDNGRAQVGLADYGRNLGSIFDQILAMGSRLIWATTTPVDEVLHHRNKGFDRLTADVDAYNSVALELAAERNIPVDDLHAVIDDAGRTRLLKEDGVHFVDEGSRLLGEAVAAFVRPFLSG